MLALNSLISELLIFFLIKVQCICNVPISAIQPSDPFIHIYTFPFLHYLPSWSIPKDWI